MDTGWSTGPLKIWNWLRRQKPLGCLHLHDPASGPRSWFKLSCDSAKEFVDVVCCPASGVKSFPLNVWFFGKWCEFEEPDNLWASCGVRTKMYDIYRFCCSFADWDDCKLWVLLCRLSGLNFSSWLLQLYETSQIPYQQECQGHATTVFCEITVRRSKNCLEFSIAWGRLKIYRWPFHSCTIF